MMEESNQTEKNKTQEWRHHNRKGLGVKTQYYDYGITELWQNKCDSYV